MRCSSICTASGQDSALKPALDKILVSAPGVILFQGINSPICRKTWTLPGQSTGLVSFYIAYVSLASYLLWAFR